MGTRRSTPDVPGQRVPAGAFGPPNRPLALAAVFGERFAGAALQRDVVLQTEDTRRVLRRDYFHLCRMLHAIARTRGFPGVEPGAVNRAEDGVAQSIRQLRETTAARRADLARRFELRPEASPVVTHPRATRFQAPVASPHAMQFLDALEAADECIALSGAAWLQGLVSPQDHQALRRQLRRGLATVKAQVQRTRDQCFGLRGTRRRRGQAGTAAQAPTVPDAAAASAEAAAAATPPRYRAPTPPPAARS